MARGTIRKEDETDKKALGGTIAIHRRHLRAYMYVLGEGLYVLLIHVNDTNHSTNENLLNDRLSRSSPIFEALMRGLGFQYTRVLLTQMIRCLLSGIALALIHIAIRLALNVCHGLSVIFETAATH
jgi:hypothetical protein